MSDVQFEGEDNKSVLYSRFEAQSQEPKMVKWLIKLGIVKTAAQANIVLIAIPIIAIGLTIYFFTLPSRNSFETASPVGPFPPAPMVEQGEVQ